MIKIIKSIIHIFSLTILLIVLGVVNSFSQKNENAQKTHLVQKGETLWSISKKYDLTVQQIIDLNPLLKTKQLQANQELVLSNQKPNNNVQNKGKAQKHTVVKGETLFAIATQYGCSVKELKKANIGLKDNLNIGQIISIPPYNNSKKEKKLPLNEQKKIETEKTRKHHTVKKGETLYAISKKYKVSVKELKDWNGIQPDGISVGSTLFVSDYIAKSTEENNSDKEETTPTEKEEEGINDDDDVVLSDDSPIQEVREEGFAELVDSNVKSKKYTALHKTAKKDTLIKIKNKMNKNWIYVRVIGTIPKGTADDNVLIKISSAAFKKLGAIDKKFPVIIHYLN